MTNSKLDFLDFINSIFMSLPKDWEVILDEEKEHIILRRIKDTITTESKGIDICVCGCHKENTEEYKEGCDICDGAHDKRT